MRLLQTFIARLVPLYPLAKRWLYRFNGGVFPRHHKKRSLQSAIRDTIIPSTLTIPLRQGNGLVATPLVNVGERVKKYQRIAEAPAQSFDPKATFTLPIYSPTSGTITAIQLMPMPHASGLNELAIIVSTDQKDEAIDNSLQTSGTPPSNAEDLKQLLFQASIIGMGGAGFPTFAKIRNSEKLHTLIVNGAECEPFITSDDVLMQSQALAILQGAQWVADALHIDTIICGIEDNKPLAIKAMHSASQQLTKSSHSTTPIAINSVPTVYPMGGEKQLISQLLDIEIAHNGHAVDQGILMFNVATFEAIYNAIKYGNPLINRMVTVNGFGVDEPFNIRALIGTSFTSLVALANPNQTVNYPLIMGGPMMGFAVKNNDVPVIKTTNCILANPPQQPETVMPCIRCGECMDACPVQLLPQQLFWHSQAHEFEKVEQLNVFDCIECGCCSYVCPSHIPLVQYYRFAKGQIKELKQEKQATELAKQRHEFKLARIEREKAEREARLKAKKEAVKKQTANTTEIKTSAKPTAVAAAARAAAAKRAAVQKAKQTSTETTNSENALANLPPARRKAIEAAQKAAATRAKQTSSSEKTTASADDKRKQAMEAAHQYASQRQMQKGPEQADMTDTTSSETAVNTETLSIEEKRKKAMEAARKRAAERNQSKQETAHDNHDQ